MAETVLAAVENLVVRQTELWQESLRATHQQWNEQTVATTQVIEHALAGALEQNVRQHAQALAEAERDSAEHNRQHWDRVQQALVENAKVAAGQQQELTRQGEILLQVVGATDQVARLEHELNRNLSALASAEPFRRDRDLAVRRHRIAERTAGPRGIAAGGLER